MARVAVYDGTNVTCTILGVELTDGIPETGFIEIITPEVFDAEPGLDDMIMMYRKAGGSLYQLNIGLRAASIHNPVLSGIHGADWVAKNGAGIAPSFIKDNNGSSLYGFTACRIKKAPDFKAGATKEVGIWNIIAVGGPATSIFGGN